MDAFIWIVLLGSFTSALVIAYPINRVDRRNRFNR